MIRAGWLLMVVTLWGCAGLVRAGVRFEHLNISHGLSNNSVRLFYQDHDGYMWMGTLNGLNRYDGYRFKDYHYLPGNPNTLQNNRLTHILQDSRGIFYLSTFDGHIHRFDAQREIFTPVDTNTGSGYGDFAVSYVYQSSPDVFWYYSLKGGCIRLISNPDLPGGYRIDYLSNNHFKPSDVVNFIQAAPNGEVWLGSSRGLLLLTDDRADFSSSAIQPLYVEGSANSVKITPQHVWVGTGANGVLQFSTANGRKSMASFNRFGPMRIQCLEQYNQYLLVGTWGDGLYVFDTQNNEVQHFQVRNSGLPASSIQSFFYDQNGLFWIVTAQRGVCSFDVYTGKITYFPLGADKRDALGDMDKQLIFKDSNNTLWVGIYGGGLSRYHRASAQFEQYLYDDKDANSLSSDYVLSIFEDRSKNLWVGTYNGGINKINITPSDFYHVTPSAASASFLSNDVRALFVDASERIWVGTRAGELFAMEQSPDWDNLKNYRIIPFIPKFKKGIYCLFEDRDKNLWIGTKGDGICVIRASERLKQNPVVMRYSETLGMNLNDDSQNVFDIHQDKHGQYWIATYSGGLYLLNDPFGVPRLSRYLADANNLASLSDNRVRQLLFDRDDNLWIATSGGLNILPANQLTAADKQFVRLSVRRDGAPGISNNDVLCMWQHASGDVYLGTFGGGLNVISHIDVLNQHFDWRYVMRNDGLSSNVINSIVEDKSGKLWLGTDNGINHYDPVTGLVERYREADGLGSNLFSESAALMTRAGQVVMGHANGLVLFNPLSLMGDTSQYRVHISAVYNSNRPVGMMPHEAGFDHSDNTLTFDFAALDYAAPDKIKYAFYLENFDKGWSAPSSQSSVTYRGLPPGSYTFKVRATNSNGMWMEAVADYSFVIHPPFWNSFPAYVIYLALLAFLVWFYYRLKVRQLRLRQELEINERLNEEKLQYYTNISHEFKTPLTLILSPVDDIITGSDVPEKVRQRALQIKKNAGYLLHLVEQILDFRRLRENKANLKVAPVDLGTFFNDIHGVFLPLAQKRGINFTVSCPDPGIIGFVDVGVMEKVCYNLLSNALKHTPQGKTIAMSVSLDASSQMLRISVMDQGVGIAPDELGKIFDRFYKSQESTGLGLFFTRELVTWHGGSIEVRSELGHGTEFMVMLPVARPKSMPDTDVVTTAARASADEVALKYAPELEVPAPEVRKASARKETLLLVEDNPNLLAFLMEKLNETYNVVGAENGRIAIEKARAHAIDLVVCDYMMPEMDGLETLKRLKGDLNTSHIPVILLTAIASEDKMLEAMALGADDYITKPFNISHLQVRIDNLINQRKRLRQVFGQEPDFATDNVPGVNADKEFIDTVTRVIDENIGNNDFSVDLIADKLNMSRTVFYKKMKLISGYSPNEFIQLIRMKKAAFLIKNSNLTISEIGLNVGFSDANYFSKCFKNHFGMPPSVYQKSSDTSAEG
ncbi:MAG: response regulator [Marinilabiliaceae bacterium]|nr:response regulator [Marinilabiliaceae bacterium]